LIKNEKQVLRDINARFKDSGWGLIIKSRFKRFLDPDYFELGDVFYDESMYPSSVFELISISERVVCNFMPSALSTETIGLGKPYHVLHHPQHDDDLLRHVNQIIPNIFNPGGKDDFLSSSDLNWVDRMIAGHLPSPQVGNYKQQYVGHVGAELSFSFVEWLKR
jgi:hypothetical protein